MLLITGCVRCSSVGGSEGRFTLLFERFASEVLLQASVEAAAKLRV